MDENVSKAVERADQYCGTYERGFAVKNAWDVIRARLVELEAENERLREDRDSHQRGAITAMARLDRAEALLREISDRTAASTDFHDLAVRIRAHLSEDGHG